MKTWWFRLGRYGLRQWRGLLLILASVSTGVLVDVLAPWPMKLILDNVLQGDPLPGQVAWIQSLPGAGSKQGVLAWLTSGTILLFLAGWLTKVARQYFQIGIGARMVYALSADLFRHLQRLSLRFHGRQQTGDLVKRVTTDTACVRELILNAAVPFLTSILTLGGMIAVMWQLNVQLAAIALLVAPLLGLCVWFFAGPMSDRSYRYATIQGDIMAAAEQTLGALPLVRAFAQEGREQERFQKVWRGGDAAYLHQTSSQLQFKIATGTVTALGTAIVISIGGFQVLLGKLSMGSLVVFLAYVASLYAPLETLAYLSASLSAAAAGARRVFEVFDREPEVREKTDARALVAPKTHAPGRIRLEGVTFGYEEGRPVLRDIHLEVHPGETIALVGSTGAGKSTLVSLIPRLFDPWQGRVTFDGIDVREVKLASLRGQISMVLQDPFILPLTVADNIAYGRPNASREEIVRAAVDANADEFIARLPQAYDTVIGERGSALSGGQRQRLAIARALLKDAPVLILDEPTSALDVQSEALFLQALYRLMQNRTTIMIAHRLSTVRRASSILVLEEGTITDRGSHEGLMNRGGLYRRLHELQFGGGTR